jgi:hypothetical protein
MLLKKVRKQYILCNLFLQTTCKSRAEPIKPSRAEPSRAKPWPMTYILVQDLQHIHVFLLQLIPQTMAKAMKAMKAAAPAKAMKVMKKPAAMKVMKRPAVEENFVIVHFKWGGAEVEDHRIAMDKSKPMYELFAEVLMRTDIVDLTELQVESAFECCEIEMMDWNEISMHVTRWSAGASSG